MDEIVAFLSRMLDADEQVAKAATPGPWDVNDEELAEAIYTVDPDSDIAVVAGGGWGGEVTVFNRTADAIHIARHDPARVLADVAAKRAILNRAVRMVDSFNAATDAPWPDASRRERSHAVETIHDLAAAYADHPDFDPAWRVT